MSGPSATAFPQPTPPLQSSSIAGVAAHPFQPISDYEKVLKDYIFIRTLERQDESKRPPVAYIRGRELFIIKPGNWRGLNFLQQIWYLFNKIIGRYQELDIFDWTKNSLRNRTIQTFTSDPYQDWLGKTYFLGEDKRQSVVSLAAQLKASQAEVERLRKLVATG